MRYRHGFPYSVQHWFAPHPARVNSSNILHSECPGMTVQLHRRITRKDLFCFSALEWMPHSCKSWVPHCWMRAADLPPQSPRTGVPESQFRILGSFNKKLRHHRLQWLPWWRSGKKKKKKKICLPCRRPGFNPWVRKIPWRRAWQPTAIIFPGESLEQSD